MKDKSINIANAINQRKTIIPETLLIKESSILTDLLQREIEREVERENEQQILIILLVFSTVT